MSGFSKVKMSAFRICIFAISLADGLICWCLCLTKKFNVLLFCKTFEINVLPKSVLLKSSIFQPVKLPGYYKSSIKMVSQVWRMPVVVNQVIVAMMRSEEHTSELQSRENLVCRLLLEKK